MRETRKDNGDWFEISQKEITKRQLQVIEFLLEYHRKNDALPTIRKVAEYLGGISPHAVLCHYDALIHKGYLERREKQTPSIKLTTKALGLEPYSSAPNVSAAFHVRTVRSWMHDCAILRKKVSKLKSRIRYLESKNNQ